jgi:hypothetical protein
VQHFPPHRHRRGHARASIVQIRRDGHAPPVAAASFGSVCSKSGLVRMKVVTMTFSAAPAVSVRLKARSASVQRQ